MPQIEDGYTRIANELFIAIICADLTKRQRKIIDLIIRCSYGFNKKVAALSPVDFTITGLHIAIIGDELRKLTSIKVIEGFPGQYSLNKKYWEWQLNKTLSIDKTLLNKILSKNAPSKKAQKRIKDLVSQISKRFSTKH